MKDLKTFENFSMRKEICDRCSEPTNGKTIMSIFNTDVICNSCKEEEKNDPDYEAATKAENDAIKNGNFNYEGLFPTYPNK